MTTRTSLVDYAAIRSWIDHRRSTGAHTDANDDLPSLLRIDDDVAPDRGDVPPADLDTISWDALFAELERRQLATRRSALRV